MRDLTIPEIRSELRAHAKRIEPHMPGTARAIMRLANELTRRSPKKRAPQKSQPMTPKLASAIRLYAASYPDRSHQEIAEHFNVNPGRVSEALRGKRGAA